MSKLTRLRLIFSSVFLAIITTSVIGFDTANKSSERKTRYLLSGNYSSVDSNKDISPYFDYYDIQGSNTEVAIAVKDEVKDTYKGTQIDQKWTITIPATAPVSHKKVTAIWHNAFHGSQLQRIKFETPNNIKVIDYEAFFASRIEEITLPYTINEIGDSAFYSCVYLTSFIVINDSSQSSDASITCVCDVPEEDPEQGESSSNPESSSIEESSSAEDISSDEEGSSEEDPEQGGGGDLIQECQLTLIPSFCFFRCTSLTTVSLPSKIKEIAEEAFNGCTALTTKFYFQNIEFIRERAFQGCTSLTEIYISKSMFNDADGTEGDIEPHAFNNIDPAHFKVTFCGNENSIKNNWLPSHSKWGYKSDYDTSAHTPDYLNADVYSTSDWTYQLNQVNLKGVLTKEITITDYHGQLPTNNGGYIVVPDSFVYQNQKIPVTRIKNTTFHNDVKSILKRIYLPITLKAIENQMFGEDYPKLYVIDDNKSCYLDEGKTDLEIDGRIDLSGLTDLEFIGTRAFCNSTSNQGGERMGKGYWYKEKVDNKDVSHYYYEKIKEIHLPYNLVAVGSESFGAFGKRIFPYVDDFKWDFNESKARLEVAGTDTFYALGYKESVKNSVEILKNEDAWREHGRSTIFFPKTFKYFGLLTADKNRYKNAATASSNGLCAFNFDDLQNTKIEKNDRPAHAFLGCSLIKKVIFKGSMEENDAKCSDLIIPLQTFCFNESLETVIFEERRGKDIFFHTQKGGSNENHYAQESIGGNSGRGGNDFRGEPFLQTLVLPNKYTNILIQPFAFHGNSRGVIYLSGSFGSINEETGEREFTSEDRFYVNELNGHWKDLANLSFNKTTLMTEQFIADGQWKNIGNEVCYKKAKNNTEKGYYGYCFTSAARDTAALNAETDPSTNTFSINQEMPVYENVYYCEKDDQGNVIAEVGKDTSGNKNSRVLVKSDKCAYLCEEVDNKKVATMTKYLYNLHDTDVDSSTARVKKTVSDGTYTYSVTKIGDSAFSACYCDGTGVGDSYTDLQYIKLPDTITEIGEYAFIRTYALKEIKSYENDINSASIRMPKSLRKIGKGAFMFSEIESVREIPYECEFYETYEDATKDISKIPSVFSNAVSLRRISFLNEAGTAEANSSKYYTATTYSYTGAQDGDVYTSALYSNKVENENKSNENKLLIVLNREVNDFSVTSEDVTAAPGGGVRFNGLYNNNDQFLFGALKMGYWIKYLVCGNPTINPEDTHDPKWPYLQPLFSAVGYRNKGNGSAVTLTAKPIYLGLGFFHKDTPVPDNHKYLYDSLDCDLQTIDGNVVRMPQYAFNGCENLLTINLRYDTGRTVPDGLFKNVSNTNTVYKTVDPNDPDHPINPPETGTLDLTKTGYAGIGQDAFNNNQSIIKLIAPKVDNFTIGVSAFESCTKLATLDLSNVTGTLTIEANAFKKTKISNIIWPQNANVVIGSSAFEECKSLVNLTLPKGLSSLGDNAFKTCTELKKVSCEGNLTSLTTIGGSAFSDCTKLDDFDFEHLTSLTTIKGSAFYNTGKLSPDGALVIANNVTSIGGSAFNKSRIVTVDFMGSSINLGGSAFANCASLTAVRFDNQNCAWTNETSTGIFNSCTSLVELQLPSGFDESNSRASIVDSCNSTILNILLHDVYTSSTSIGTTWREISGIPAPNYHFRVDTLQQLKDSNEISGTDTINSKAISHWAVLGGHAVVLGKIDTYSGGVLVFENGYVLDSNGIAKIIPITTTGGQVDGHNQYTGSVSAHQGEALAFKLGDAIINPANVVNKTGDANNLYKDSNNLRLHWGTTDTIYLEDLGDGNWNAWLNKPATPASYSIIVNKVASGSAQSQESEGTDKGKFTVTLAINDVISVKYNEDTLYIGESGTISKYTALRPGTYTIYINGSDRVFIAPPAKSASNITTKVNDLIIPVTDVKPGGSTNTVEYVIDLSSGDIVTFNEGYDVIQFHNVNPAVNSFTATKNGPHRFYINGSWEAYLSEPIYLVGSFNEWTYNLSEYALSVDPENSNHYSLSNVELTEGDTFKLRDGETYYSNETTWDGCGFTLPEGAYGNIRISTMGKYTIHIYLDAGNNKISLTVDE